jgi:hypothetical protein
LHTALLAADACTHARAGQAEELARATERYGEGAALVARAREGTRSHLVSAAPRFRALRARA